MTEPTFPRLKEFSGYWGVEYSTGEVDASLLWDRNAAERVAMSYDADGKPLRICNDCGGPAGLWQPPWDDLEPFWSCQDSECCSADTRPASEGGDGDD